jgi:hypothetical protein
MIAWLPVLAVLLAAATDPAPARSAEPASEALVDRFMAVIPGADRFERIDRTPNPDELERLTGLNPGRDADVRAVLAEHAGCLSEGRNRRTKERLRGMARQLGDANLRRIVTFYEREEWRVLVRLSERSRQDLSAEDRAELDRLRAEYPLDALVRAINPLDPAFRSENSPEDLQRCSRSLFEALDRLGLRVAPAPVPVVAQ